MKYEPEYAEGQILVHFKIPVAHGFAETLGEFLGYKALEESYSYGDNVFIYETGKGKEKQALKKFLEQKPFVDWTNRRDIKLEKRWEDLEIIIGRVEELRDNSELPDKEYNRKLDQLCNYLQKLKTK